MSKKIILFGFALLLLISFAAAPPMSFPGGAMPLGETQEQGCANKVFGLVGASNTVDANPDGSSIPSSWKNVNIIKELCPGATVFLSAKGGTWPGAQQSLVQVVLQNDNLDNIIIDPSANGQPEFSGISAQEYKDAVIKLAQMVKDKDSSIKVIILTNTPLKGAAGGYGTPETIQKVKDFNNDLLYTKLGRPDLIDYAVNTYSATEDPAGSDACGKYCSNDHLHFGEAGRRLVIKAIIDAVFGGSAAAAPTQTTPITLVTTYPSSAENCLDKQRCFEIDNVWLQIVKWVNNARKGQVYDSATGWRSYLDTRPGVVITPTPMSAPKPEVTPTPTSTNFCVATQGSNEQKALLDMVAWAEGTREKYNIMFSGKEFSSYASHPVQTGEMPSGGITANGYSSTAAGRYQFLFTTYKGLQDMGYFNSGFNPQEQDVAALALLERRGVFDVQLKSATSESSFVSILDKLAPEWASLPYGPKGGKSYYDQPVQSKIDLLNVYQSCLQFHQTGNVPVSTLPSTGEAQFSDAGYKASGGGWLCPENAPQPNAGLTEDEQFNGCPKGMVKINNFCIDKYEASLVKMDGTPWSPYCDPKLHHVQVKAVSLEGAVPQSNINQLQAKAACENTGKRLCTDSEWSRACQGPQGSTYPYGSIYSPSTCNRRDASIHVVARLISEHPEYFPGLLPPSGGQNAWNTQPYMQHPALNQQTNTLTKTGEKTQCVSADGVYDLYGNVYEWTADPEGTFRGDYYQLTPRSAANEGCLNKVTGHAAAYSDYSIGFRCCADSN